MCYSAQIDADYKRMVRKFGPIMGLDAFARLWLRHNGLERSKVPKAVIEGMRPLLSAGVVAELDARFAEDEQAWQQELFKQSKRKADNERKPMRYQLRMPGKPASSDFVVGCGTGRKRLSGTYNARRDNLKRFWAQLFGRQRGIIIVDRFWENVEGEGGQNQVVKFAPRTGQPMLVACLWAEWTDPKGEEPALTSFAAITDEPGPEAAAAGHDRTIINIKPEHLEAWLNPDPNDLGGLYEIFDDKRPPLLRVPACGVDSSGSNGPGGGYEGNHFRVRARANDA